MTITEALILFEGALKAIGVISSAAASGRSELTEEEIKQILEASKSRREEAESAFEAELRRRQGS